METSAYVSLSGQLALEQRMATIAQNIANASTTGYRASGVNFATVISTSSPYETAFSSPGKNHISEAVGGYAKTGNPLDVAVQGQSYLAMQSGNQIYYSRDGRLTLAPDGQLKNPSGHAVLDSGGAPVSIEPGGGEITIAKDGGVYQNGSRKATIGLFSIDTASGFQRFENSGIIPRSPAEAVADFSREGLVQGFVEESNVNPITEMVRLIQVTRAFESLSTMSDKAQEAERNAIQILGSR
jgi:flagellar basal-body rod protein FlgF